MNTKLLEDYLNIINENKEISVYNYYIDEDDKSIIVVEYSYVFKNGDYGDYNQITGVSIIDLMGFLYSKIK